MDLRPAVTGAVVPHAYLKRFLPVSHVLVVPISEKIRAMQTQVGHEETSYSSGGLRDVAGAFSHGTELC